MRLPRDISGDELARLLHRNYGYVWIRQRGSHMRMTTSVTGVEHHVSVPRHRNLNVGLLRSILSDVGEHFGISQDELRRELFG